MKATRSYKKLLILFFFTLLPFFLMGQNSRADSLKNEVGILETEANRKIDSLRMDVEQKMTELKSRLNDSLMKKQVFVENELAELQRTYQLEQEKIQLKADMDSLPPKEVDKMVRDLESRLELEQDALDRQIELEMELLNDYFEQLQRKIEKEAEIEMQKIEVEYNLKIKKLEEEL